VLALSELVKHYHLGEGEPIRAVDGVSMTVSAGEFVVVYGPSGSGKSALSRAVACEANCVWFDLSPKIVDKWSASDIERIPVLVHMVFELATVLAPSVIYIDECDKIFAQANKKDSSPYSRLRQSLVAHKTKLTCNPPIRVLIIGNSRQPFADRVDQEELRGLFGADKNGVELYLPFPDHATRMQLWRHFLEETGVSATVLQRDVEDFSLATLAFLSEGYPSGTIQSFARAILTHTRIRQAADLGRAITMKDFIKGIARLGSDPSVCKPTIERPKPTAKPADVTEPPQDTARGGGVGKAAKPAGGKNAKPKK